MKNINNINDINTIEKRASRQFWEDSASAEEVFTYQNYLLRSGIDRYGLKKSGEYRRMWCEEAQLWMSPSAATNFESGCVTEDAIFEAETIARLRVIHSIKAVGVAVITDSSFAEELENRGYHTLPCGDYDNEWIEVFRTKEDLEKWLESGDGEVTYRR